MASPNCVRMASDSFVDDEGCWNANVVVNSDLGGAAWHHACNFVVFDAALSIPAAACLSQTVSVFVLRDMECSGPVMRAAWQHGMLAATVKAAIVRILAGQTIINFAAMADAYVCGASGVITLSVAVSADNTINRVPVAKSLAYIRISRRPKSFDHVSEISW
ncbi:hypothetical protein Tco_1265348 [Tanacetum coccineum]